MQPNYTAGLLLGRTPEGRFIIANALLVPEDEVGVERIIKAVASQDGRRVKIRLHQDPGSAGKCWGRYLVRRLEGYAAKAVLVSGSKVIRAEPVAAQARVGNVLILRDPEDSPDKWNEHICSRSSARFRTDSMTTGWMRSVTRSTSSRTKRAPPRSLAPGDR